MEKTKYQRYRVCYENGDSVTGKKIYELHAFCNCEDCKNRKAWRNEPRNCATATTKDILKVGEVIEFLKNWTCKDGKRHLKVEYFRF